MKISTIIIDDENLARHRLTNLIKDIPELDLISTSTTGKDAILQINNLKPQLIFLDIQLKNMTGFDVLNQINKYDNLTIIFVTAYDEYALKAFDFFAFDYLLKPFKDERFYKAVKNVISSHQTNNSVTSTINNLLEYVQENRSIERGIKKLPVKLGNKVFFIKTDSIKYILASSYYAEIYTSEKKYILRDSLTNLCNKLDSEKFSRIHRSTIVNIDYIDQLIHSNHGEVDVKTVDNKILRVSKSYKKGFQNSLGL
ncbi:LytR/AlgR family response regulator transcription factor [Tenacibaculum ovolyticum]|uniref:LytR/AlgR family response regulator transcription factor n=1 Tax=Tenacibaculum ovolyticum TaxID=104270 RepID=UPI003BA91088